MIKGLLKLCGLIVLLGILAAIFVPAATKLDKSEQGAPNQIPQSSSPSSVPPPSSDQVKAATKGLVATHDKVKDLDWFNSRSAQGLTSGVYAYIGHKQGESPWLRIVFRYHGSSWVFAKRVLVRAGDTLYTVKPDKWFRDSDTAVLEQADMDCTPTLKVILDQVINKDTILRFEGDGRSHDVTVNQAMKLDLKKVLDAYAAMGGTINES